MNLKLFSSESVSEGLPLQPPEISPISSLTAQGLNQSESRSRARLAMVGNL